MTEQKYLFGPVPSRRFGRSLGVDLTPHKTCSLDCVFCQLGRTTHKKVTRREYVPTDAVIAELETWLAQDGHADFITLSGSGEPTLHSRFGEVIEFIRTRSSIPAALLTNGTMFHLSEVRDAASLADVVKLSLSAWGPASFGWLNRPHRGLPFEQLIEGHRRFRARFRKALWLEVFLVPGMNTAPSDVRRIADLAGEIKPERIHLNTAVRPAAEDFVTPLSRERLGALCGRFNPEAEIMADFNPRVDLNLHVNKQTIFSLLRRRPCTADQIAEGFGMHLNEVLKYLGNLMQNDQIREERKNGSVYYAAGSKENRHFARVG